MHHLTVGAFDVLGVQPILGRGFREGDDRVGAEPVMLLGYDLWRDWFGGAPDIIGQNHSRQRRAAHVIGVMPQKFAFPIREALWTPLAIEPNARKRGEEPF